MTAEPSFGDQLESETEAYLNRLNDCVMLFPVVLEQYAEDGDYQETVEEIQTIESECDEMNRRIIAHITNADPEKIGLLNTRINFNESALIELYKNVDVVANLTERIVQELVMIQPAHDTACFDGLREMADHIVEMTATLEGVVERFVHTLCSAYETDSLAEEIEDIRAGESRCDELRNDVITTGFREYSTDQALVYREFAILFDELANKIEDITDQIIIIATKEPGLTTELGPDLE